MQNNGELTSPARIQRIAAEIGTPLYLIDPSRIIRAMDSLRSTLASRYPNCEITYSVKTNYLAAILGEVLAAHYRLEVVSRHELALAQSAGAEPRQLLFNGPVKSEADLRLCHERKIDVNVDSLDELAIAASLGSSASPFRLGLRVAATLQNGALSRFGLDFDDPATVASVREIQAAHRDSLQIVGLHLHHSSRRDAQSYCDRLDRLLAVAALLDLHSPEYLDLGGGLASLPPPSVAARLAYPIDSHEHFASTLGAHALKVCGRAGPRLILEPGIGVLAGAMNYVTSIVAVKSRGSVGTAPPIAVCDGSMFDINPLRSTIPPPCVLVPSATSRREISPASGPVKLYGATCMEIDHLGFLDDAEAPLPQTGDLVVVTNIGAYSACLAPEFIIPPPPVYSLDLAKIIRPRPRAGQYQGAGIP